MFVEVLKKLTKMVNQGDPQSEIINVIPMSFDVIISFCRPHLKLFWKNIYPQSFIVITFIILQALSKKGVQLCCGCPIFEETLMKNTPNLLKSYRDTIHTQAV